MKLQICGGKYKRTQINIPDNIEGLRPAKSMVREAICNILQTKIAGSTVLDLCAGTCAFSMEMISRGAKRAVAVEQNSVLCNLIKKEIKKHSWSENIEVLCTNAESFVEKCEEKFDIIYFDPPYYENKLSALVVKLADLCKENAVIIFEFASGDKFVEENYSKYGFRKYGKSSILLINRV